MNKHPQRRIWCPNAAYQVVIPREQRDYAAKLVKKGLSVEFHTHAMGASCEGLATVVANEDGVVNYPDDVCWGDGPQK